MNNYKNIPNFHTKSNPIVRVSKTNSKLYCQVRKYSSKYTHSVFFLLKPKQVMIIKIKIEYDTFYTSHSYKGPFKKYVTGLGEEGGQAK